MKVVFSTHVSDDWREPVGANKLISSAKYWHPEIPFVVFGSKEINELFDAGGYYWDNLIPTFCARLADDYDLVVHFDADSIIADRLDELLQVDYDVAGVRNNNDNGKAGNHQPITIPGLVGVNEYLNCGLVASTKKEFWQDWIEGNKNAHQHEFGEQHILNTIVRTGKYKLKILDAVGTDLYYGIANAFGEQHSLESWKLATVDNENIRINGKKCKVFHEADGHRIPKLDIDLRFPAPVVNKMLKWMPRQSFVLRDVRGLEVELNKYWELYRHFMIPSNYGSDVLITVNEESSYRSMFGDSKDLTILDVGANVGLYSYFFASCAKHIYAIEPYGPFCEVMRSAVKEMGLKNISIHECGIGAKTGRSSFYIHSGNTTMNSTTKQVHHNGECTVNIFTINDFMTENNIEYIDLVKMDIEGSEMEVILSDSFTKIAKKIGCLGVSIHPTSLETNADIIRSRLNSIDFEVKKCSVEDLCACI